MTKMLMINSIFLFLNLFSIPTNAELKIEFLNVVFRHGDRAPGNHTYPNDPYKIFNYKLKRHGELTNAGKRRMYLLGGELRKLYGDFIGEDYSSTIVNARSTDGDRYKMSCELVMASLFQPKNDQIWNEKLNWQPTIVNVVPSYLDILMFPQECPQYLKEFSKVQELPEIKLKVSKFDDFMKNLTKWTGHKINSAADMYHLYHTLSLENALNLTLPDWTKGVFPDGLLLNGTVLEYEIASYGTTLKRLNGGVLLRNFTESMLDVINSKTNNVKKLNLYSGDQKNVATLLNTLGVFTPHVPQFSSAVILELLSDCGEYYVKVRYYKGIPEETITLKIPGCDELCPFENFTKLMEPVIPSDDELYCPKLPLNILIKKIYDDFIRI
ncbi:hypothetical protein HCN44_010764 [Aphidius gifuensis]|uniref:acid phosphatase n=1 Tax=Aphidius gifuensis TaxID=684658 RepID=A0A834XR82_APHGI|nr:hypothetical protein HCN44_010764 [Aphidius gifuensis]